MRSTVVVHFGRIWMLLTAAVVAAYVSADEATRTELLTSGGAIDVLIASACLVAASIAITAMIRTEHTDARWVLIPVVALFGTLDRMGWGTQWLWDSPVIAGERVEDLAGSLRAGYRVLSDAGADHRLVWAGIGVVTATGLWAIWHTLTGRLYITSARTTPLITALVALALVSASVVVEAVAPHSAPVASALLGVVASGLLVKAGLSIVTTVPSLAGWRRRLQPWVPSVGNAHRIRR